MFRSAASIFFVIFFQTNVLIVCSEDLCDKYSLKCQYSTGIFCRERVGGVTGAPLRSDILLSCPYPYDGHSYSWTFTNSSNHSIPLTRPHEPRLALSHINKTREGVYACSVTLPDKNVYTERTFLFVAGHAYFQSCSEASNGKKCTGFETVRAVANRSAIFNTRVGYRDGGSCGQKQEIRYLVLRKNKNSVYFCSNFDSSAKRQKCPNTTRWTVVGQGEDKFDFKLMMNNTRKSDAGMYELELRMADVGGSISIYRNYSLLVSDAMPTLAPTTTVATPPTAEPRQCNESRHQTHGPVMVFLGDILRNNSNITSKSLGEKERALLCVVPNQGSDVNADFLRPNGTVIEDTPHLPLYVSKGDQIVRLNSGTADGNVIDSGKYCCTVSSQDRNYDPLCVHLV